jgi:hypothetical protein
MDEDKAARTNPEAEGQKQPQEQPQAKPPVAPARPSAYSATRDVGWASAPTSQVARTVAVALLTAVVVLVALFLLWQVRTFVGWFVIALFLAAVLNPAVNWLQRRHRLIKRPIATDADAGGADDAPGTPAQDGGGRTSDMKSTAPLRLQGTLAFRHRRASRKRICRALSMRPP